MVALNPRLEYSYFSIRPLVGQKYRCIALKIFALKTFYDCSFKFITEVKKKFAKFSFKIIQAHLLQSIIYKVAINNFLWNFDVWTQNKKKNIAHFI